MCPCSIKVMNLNLLAAQASLSASPHLSYGDRRVSRGKDNPEPPLPGSTWIGHGFSIARERRHSQRAGAFLLQSDSCYQKSCGNATCSPRLFLPPSQGTFALLRLPWKYPADEKSRQVPLNSQVFYSLFRHRPTICPDSASYC